MFQTDSQHLTTLRHPELLTYVSLYFSDWADVGGVDRLSVLYLVVLSSHDREHQHVIHRPGGVVQPLTMLHAYRVLRIQHHCDVQVFHSSSALSSDPVYRRLLQATNAARFAATALT